MRRRQGSAGAPARRRAYALSLLLVLIGAPVGAVAVTTDAVEKDAGAALLGTPEHPGPAFDVPSGAQSEIPVLDATTFDAAAWASRPGATTATWRFTLPAGTETYTMRFGGHDGVSVSPRPALHSTTIILATLPPDGHVALCMPMQSGLHYTTTPAEQDACPFTWHDGEIRETFLGCAVAGDCTIAGQDAPTGGTFWVICFGPSASARSWGVVPGVDVQCESGSIGSSPQTWTHWNSWCRVFGLTSGTAVCGHVYG